MIRSGAADGSKHHSAGRRARHQKAIKQKPSSANAAQPAPFLRFVTSVLLRLNLNACQRSCGADFKRANALTRTFFYVTLPFLCVAVFPLVLCSTHQMFSIKGVWFLREKAKSSKQQSGPKHTRHSELSWPIRPLNKNNQMQIGVDDNSNFTWHINNERFRHTSWHFAQHLSQQTSSSHWSTEVSTAALIVERIQPFV